LYAERQVEPSTFSTLKFFGTDFSVWDNLLSFVLLFPFLLDQLIFGKPTGRGENILPTPLKLRDMPYPRAYVARQ